MVNFTPNSILSGVINIFDLLSSFTAVDAVGIFDQESLEQVFFNARPLKAEVKETSTVMSHPVETGVMLSDHHIINQVEINISLFIKSEYYSSVYGQIKKAFIAADKLIIQTRTGIYNNMIIADMPHMEDPETFDAVTMGLHLKEVLYIVPTSVSSPEEPANFSPADPADTNTVQSGLKYATPLSSGSVSAVQNIFAGVVFKSLGF